MLHKHYSFQVIPPTLNLTPPMKITASPVPLNNNYGPGDSTRLHSSSILTIGERVQLLHKENSRSKEVTYKGNPDLQPIRTYEVACMVHRLNDLAQQLNETVIWFFQLLFMTLDFKIR